MRILLTSLFLACAFSEPGVDEVEFNKLIFNTYNEIDEGKSPLARSIATRIDQGEACHVKATFGEYKAEVLQIRNRKLDTAAVFYAISHVFLKQDVPRPCDNVLADASITFHKKVLEIAADYATNNKEHFSKAIEYLRIQNLLHSRSRKSRWGKKALIGLALLFGVVSLVFLVGVVVNRKKTPRY